VHPANQEGEGQPETQRDSEGVILFLVEIVKEKGEVPL